MHPPRYQSDLHFLVLEQSNDLSKVPLHQWREPFRINPMLDEVLIKCVVPEVVLVACNEL
jgi:hypothetical protein